MIVSHLPSPASSLVGRAGELTGVATLLADPSCRLLTIVGPGGIGKTRLAIQSAADQRPNFSNGVHFVPLTPVGAPDLIVSAIATALHLTFYGSEALHDQIVRYLREKQTLLVMDNFEHLLDGVGLLTDILESAPDVRFLVTSRERLNIQEEWVFALDGLSVPDTQSASPLESYAAVQLFVQRARQVQANFSLVDNAEAVTIICQRVEGMPLGLELAASWLRALSCRQIAAQMAQSLDFLTTPLRNVPERHRSLRAVFEQSWKLLTEVEQRVLMNLSVFRGGFDLEAAEAVAGASLFILAGLVDKSLIRLNANGRYDLHELLRQYAADKLTASEASDIANHHLDYYLKLAETAEPYLWSREQMRWYDRLESEIDNLRAALAWSPQSEAGEAGLRLAAALGWFFLNNNHPSEGVGWFEQLVAADHDVPVSVRVKALARAAELTGVLADVPRARSFAEQALALARPVDDRESIAWALATLGFYCEYNHPDLAARLLDESIALFREVESFRLADVLQRRANVALFQQDYPYAHVLLEEALQHNARMGDQITTAWTHYHLAIVFADEDRRDQARSHLERSLTLFQEVRNQYGAAIILNLLAWDALHTGNHPRAEALHREALDMMRVISPNHGVIDFIIAGLATNAKETGNLDQAAKLAAISDRGLKTYNEGNPETLANMDKYASSLREEMGEAAFNTAWGEGISMTRDQAIAYALETAALPTETPLVERDDFTPSQQQPTPESLSKRELEILRLISEGLSNGEIADQLILAKSTIKWYVNQIFSKLHVTTRTQAIAQAQRLNLL